MTTRKRMIVRLVPGVLAGLIATGVGVGVSVAGTGSTSSTGASSTTSEVVTAANAFLASLSATQKSAVSYSYSDTTNKSKWSNLPTTMTGRPGLKLDDLTSAQQLALAVVRAELSDQGYTEEE